MLWDESSWEKPESRQLEDLGPTRSSQAARLTHIKPGYYTPPGRPVCVPGMQWLAVLLVGRLVEQGTHVHPRERSPLASTPTGGKPPGHPHQSTSRRRWLADLPLLRTLRAKEVTQAFPVSAALPPLLADAPRTDAPAFRPEGGSAPSVEGADPLDLTLPCCASPFS